ncbi:MAG TPA: YtxH domain-containing protein [Acidimicrobiia bacterium]
MRFRAGLIAGFAAGYVLGTRAGRERYEQIKRVTGKARTHPAVAQVVEQMTAVADLARDGVAGGLDAGARGLRSMAEPGSGTG